MTKATNKTALNPLILRCHRLMDAFAKSDDERDFYLDRYEGFLIFIDLMKTQTELDNWQKEYKKDPERFCFIPKLTFYETKKIMEGFVNEKVYDVDTKEKLIDIIQSKDARENFLEFIYDNLSELEKWQAFYQERFRIRIIEWLRGHEIIFVFEEDLDLSKALVEKLRKTIFQAKAPKDVQQARLILKAKSKIYYSNEALNPRPKRGRPPKQTQKQELEPEFSDDIYHTVTATIRPMVYTPDITNASSVTFSSRFDSTEALMANLRTNPKTSTEQAIDNLNKRIESLKNLSKQIAAIEEGNVSKGKPKAS